MIKFPKINVYLILLNINSSVEYHMVPVPARLLSVFTGLEMTIELQYFTCWKYIHGFNNNILIATTSVIYRLKYKIYITNYGIIMYPGINLSYSNCIWKYCGFITYNSKILWLYTAQYLVHWYRRFFSHFHTNFV